MKSFFVKALGKPILGIGLLALIVWQLDIVRLMEVVNRIDVRWFLLGLFSLMLSNILSAYRWSRISEHLGVSIRLSAAIRLYAQGITANTLLPGGIIGGDIWRTLGLVRRGASKATAGLTVLLDRISGVWVLAICSLLALIVLICLESLPSHIPVVFILGYGLGLLGLGVLPIAFLRAKPLNTQVLLDTFGVSLLVQVLALIAFWTCFKALGLTLPFLAFTAVCAGIFILAVMPAAIGGFGAREVGAVVLMTSLGVAPEASFLGSVLYGLMATLQGVLSMYWWVQRDQR